VLQATQLIVPPDDRKSADIVLNRFQVEPLTKTRIRDLEYRDHRVITLQLLQLLLLPSLTRLLMPRRSSMDVPAVFGM
jgi:hypothetical protein